MCGVAGVLDPKQQTSHEALADVAARMADTLRHRGPNDGGTWVDADAGVAFGHRRLSVIDLSPTGAQPMVSPGGRYVVTYNGEIYNYRELREQLETVGVGFAGSCDTEILAGALDAWGLDKALERLDGMFAFGAWDREQRQLHLVRDRFGEKPLHYGWSAGRLLFASELRAVTAITGPLDIDTKAVVDVLTFKCVQAPRTIYREFTKVLPGQIVTFDADGRRHERRYWSASQVAFEAMQRPLQMELRDATDELTERLERTVQSRMVADVPLGAFLSGGIDSAVITALMVKTSSASVKTFTVGLDHSGYDESDQAAAVARHLGTEHYPLRVTPDDVMDLVPRVAEAYDEPFADSSQLPTLLVSSLASDHVKVALTGDGGDEVFGGYNRHVFGDRLVAAVEALPSGLTSGVGRWLQDRAPDRADALFERIAPVLPEQFRVRLPADKLHKVGRIFEAGSARGAYHSLVIDKTALRFGPATSSESPTTAEAWQNGAAKLRFSQRAMIADTQTYLPNDILVKVDRAAMAVSLETRAPFLDHHLYEWAWRLPHAVRVGSNHGKRVLRACASRELGPVELPTVKSGFGVPIGEWLRGPLRDWAGDLVNVEDDYVDRDALRAVWSEHRDGRWDHTHALWSVLMLRSWLASRRSIASQHPRDPAH